VARHHPRKSLRAYVDYLWVVRWDVPEPFHQNVLTQPKVHLAAEDDRLKVYGVSRRLFHRRIEGRGQAIGVAFRPGGFRPFLPDAMRVSALAGLVVNADQLWDVDDRALARRALSAPSDEAMVQVMEDALESLRPQPDPDAERAADLVALIESEPGLRRVDELAARAGLSVRAVQRLFSTYVGASPKWVIQRRRLLDAAEAVHAGTEVVWADVAAHLGYSDQAHLIRDFTAAVGTSPAAYARSTV
jgi:AraC-like DNA-binding protein